MSAPATDVPSGFSVRGDPASGRILIDLDWEKFALDLKDAATFGARLLEEVDRMKRRLVQ
jgi:hypothetical protein